MKRATALLGALCNLSEQSTVPPGAGLAGPAFPAPSSLHGSDTLKTAVHKFEKSIAGAPVIQANETAWTVAVFSTSEEEPLYEIYFTPDYNVGVSQVDRDSVFRIASVSKVFSVWTFLMEVGDEHFSDPITKYVPELAALSDTLESGTVYDDIDNVRWAEVTLGQLASHLAGIPRDPSQTDFSAGLLPQQGEALGLPPLEASEIPVCGVTGVLRPCSRSEMISQLLKQHPIFPSGHSPAYTNVAYTLLGYAQEAITGRTAGEAITTNIFSALNMTSSSFASKPSSGGVIPGDESAVGWDWDLGPSSPSGSIYCSTADMVKAGRAILGSKTLTPAQTRRWLKPMSQTGVLGSAVGAPWEIRHLMLGQRLSQLYTKQGDIGGYRAALILAPEHEMGAVVLSAGPTESNSAAVRETLMNAVGRVFLPMAEEQARREARDNFAATFTDKASNSSVTVHVDKDTPGLMVKSLISRGVEVIGPSSPFLQIYGAGESARLFPTLLKTVRKRSAGSGTFISRLGFRASFFNATGDMKEVQDPGLMQWTSLGAPTYGATTLDDWVFEMGEDGRAEALDVRMLRLKLVREAGGI
ncbi:beta-lactamase/transpeptidase-like protein [Microdochium trichocladiopsis]|uniref:Beta-lactamase/transpeptidase-like protein n=1 Tax=Microdochium trichocladiopsis TaxID=1682393 RepID=A0A9P8Y2A3_9PEZI|nr:beta-lactamase/transpeptidase-like protein [Microdochium trichocladiopsis]KAH7026731.1 beta-lactamase/transpeptidase-like protein [Microdochium trichocladiopsis]